MIEKLEEILLDEYVIFTKTDLKGVITYASTAFSNVCGYSKEELVGQPHNIIRHPDMPASAFEDLWKTIEAGDVWQGTVKNLKKDGGYYIAKSIVRPILDNDDNIVGYSSVREDISNQIKAEEFQKKLGHLIKETKFKQINTLNEYKKQILEKDILIEELTKENKILARELSTATASVDLMETKVKIQEERIGAKQKHFKPNEVDNSQE